MSRGSAMKAIVVFMVCAVPLAGCETAGQSAVLGSALGAGAGAAIGHQSGHAAEGALIGAAVGGLAGFAIGKHVEEKQVATEAEVKQKLEDEGKPVPTEPTMEIKDVAPAEPEVKAGDELVLLANYTTLNAPEAPKATMRVLRDDKELISEDLTITKVGETDLKKTLQIPEGMEAGDYTVELTMKNVEAVDTKQCTFTVV